MPSSVAAATALLAAPEAAVLVGELGGGGGGAGKIGGGESQHKFGLDLCDGLLETAAEAMAGIKGNHSPSMDGRRSVSRRLHKPLLELFVTLC